MTRVSVIFKSGDWTATENKYVFPDEITSELNTHDDEDFININGIICRAGDVRMVLVDEVEKGDVENG